MCWVLSGNLKMFLMLTIPLTPVSQADSVVHGEIKDCLVRTLNESLGRLDLELCVRAYLDSGTGCLMLS